MGTAPVDITKMGQLSSSSKSAASIFMLMHLVARTAVHLGQSVHGGGNVPLFAVFACTMPVCDGNLSRMYSFFKVQG